MAINSFGTYLVEEERTVFFTFGRMNPPTIGHEKLLNTLAAKAGRNPYRVYLSQSQDKNKNPLSYMDKIKVARKMFPKHARQILINKKVKNVMDIATALYDEGFKRIVMVVGSDRIREFDILLNKYNGQKARHGFYNFEKITILSAGERDPDADDVSGMSASKMRAAAKANDFTSFSQGLSKAMSNSDSKKLFNDIRNAMGIKEEASFKNHVELAPVSEEREAFVSGELFKEGDEVIIKKTDEVGTITHLGANYIIVETAERKTRQWLDAVEIIDEAAKPRWKRAGPNGEIEITIKGQRYKIEKALDHNERHKGEFKIMMWDARRRSWEWDNTVQGKAYAKELVMDKLDESTDFKIHPDVVKAYKKTLDADDKHAEYGTTITKRNATRAANHLSKKIKQHHGDLDMQGKINLRTRLQNEDKNPQDPDIGHRKGTQPVNYHKGLKKSTKIARDRHFQKNAKKADDDRSAYKPAPGDKKAKTRPSKYTLKFKQMFGDD